MKWLKFLHFYQPANQQKDILEAVAKESYEPILKKIDELEDISITLNIGGSLLELFEKYGYKNLLRLIRRNVKNGKIELTGSCKYHAIIPLIPDDEIERQITQNEETINRILGFDYKPKGFFPTEMAYHPKLDKIIEKLGYEWIILDEIACMRNGEFLSPDKRYVIAGTDITVFFRSRRVSNLVMSAVARDVETLKQATVNDRKNPYLVTGMDGETFGHHRIGHENFLFDILEDPDLGVMSFSKYLSSDHGLKTEEVSPQPCTWASSIQDIENNVQFLSWDDPDNEIHEIQWKFLRYVMHLVKNYPEDGWHYSEIRKKLDIALASDHFWWASAKPWWSLEMIEDGAYRLLDVVETFPDTYIDEKQLFKAYKYYQDIVSMAAKWQREGIIRKMAIEQHKILRIPFKERTFDKGGVEKGIYEAFMAMFLKQEKKAAKDGDYEKAILWRDAQYKLEHKYDLYDAINVIDLLRVEIGNGEVEKTLDKYTAKYKKLRGGQPEQRGS